jgi:hypothetical protein
MVSSISGNSKYSISSILEDETTLNKEAVAHKTDIVSSPSFAQIPIMR